MTVDTRRELAHSSRSLLALLPDPASWGGAPSPFKGIAVGAIQSGKTSAMMGLTASALDHGYKVVVVLAGLTDDLRRQTARRFNDQVLRQSDQVPGSPGETTLGTPSAPGPLGGFALPYSVDASLFGPLQMHMLWALERSQPCVVVVKKNVQSIQPVRNALDFLGSKYGPANLPTLILDDECDEATVGISGTAAEAVPAAVSSLWRSRAPDAHTTYVGFTATAAANLLQKPESPLFPSHFVYLLRYAAETDSDLTYKVVEPDGWYTGGETFYGEFGDEPAEESNFLVSATINEDHLQGQIAENASLREALRAYFVGGAYRLALDPHQTFSDPLHSPEPHSMLIHTSPFVAEHESWRTGIASMFSATPGPDRAWALDAGALKSLLDSEEHAWRIWFDRFSRSRERIYRERPHPGVQRLVTWEMVRSKLEEVFGNVRLKVVNSDPRQGASLDFESGEGPSPRVTSMKDRYVIVIGGSSLSRGITIEGLCVSYFARWVPNPREDTVQQMSRWFGYRAPYLEFCRLFTSQPVFSYLGEMNTHDTELRFLLSDMMRSGRSPADASVVLGTSPHSQPTAKTGRGMIVDLQFSGHPTVFQRVECGRWAKENEQTALDLVRGIQGRSPIRITTGLGRDRGLLSRKWSASEVASWLERMRYSGHNPDPVTRPLRQHYRAADPSEPKTTGIHPSADPYLMAAYLKSWVANESSHPPAFNVGVAFGEMAEDTGPFSFALSNRTVSPEGRLVGEWTGRSSNWSGDALFDNPPPALLRRRSAKRLVGADGLLLLYIIHKGARGRAGTGIVRAFHTPTFGISIPEGGPECRWVIAEES